MVRKSKDSTKREEDKMNDYRACGLYVRFPLIDKLLKGNPLRSRNRGSGIFANRETGMW